MQYFSTNRGFGAGLNMLGFSFGSLISPLLVTYLTEVYGWRGSMLIMAAIMVHIVAFGALFIRPSDNIERDSNCEGRGSVTDHAEAIILGVNSATEDRATGNSTERDNATEDRATGNSTERDNATEDRATGNSTEMDSAAEDRATGNSTERDSAAEDRATGNSTERDSAAGDGTEMDSAAGNCVQGKSAERDNGVVDDSGEDNVGGDSVECDHVGANGAGWVIVEKSRAEGDSAGWDGLVIGKSGESKSGKENAKEENMCDTNVGGNREQSYTTTECRKKIVSSCVVTSREDTRIMDKRVANETNYTTDLKPTTVLYTNRKHSQEQECAKVSNHGVNILSSVTIFLKDVFDLTLLKKYTFVGLLLACMCGRYNLTTFTTHMPNKMVVLEYTKEQAAFTMSLFSISTICTRIVVSFIANLQWVNRTFIYGCGIMVGGVASLLTMIHNYTGLAVAAVTHGLNTGKFLICRPKPNQDICKSHS